MFEAARYARNDSRPYEGAAFLACRHYVAPSGDSRAAVIASGSRAHCAQVVREFKAAHPALAAVSDFSIDGNP
jgi:hypothetical protein